MPLKFDIRSVAHTASRVALRFWPVLAVAFCAWACAIGLIWHKDLPLDLSRHPNFENRTARTMFVLVVGLATVLSGCILGERSLTPKSPPPPGGEGTFRTWRWAWVGLSLLLTGLLLWWFQSQDLNDDWHMLRLAALGGCAHLLVAAAPFLNRGTEAGFWQYNRILFIRLFTGVLYTGTLMAGLTIAYVVTCELFGYDEKETVLGTLAATLGFLFHTWYFLAGVPAPSFLPAKEEGNTWASLETDPTYPKPLKLFTQFVLLPLVLIYLLILYAYMGKIVVQQEWPKGLVSYLVFGFSILGILAFLLVWPLRSPTPNRLPLEGRGLAWVKSFNKAFYIALLPLTVLEALALAKRIGDYGLTEERVILAALTLWLMGATLAGLATGGRRIRYIPVSLAAAVLLICFGPLEASSVSIKSQSSRLNAFLEARGSLKEGKAVRSAERKGVKPEEAQNLFSMLDYLDNHNRLDDWANAYIDPRFSRRMQAEKDSLALLRDRLKDPSRMHLYFVDEVDSVAAFFGYDRTMVYETGDTSALVSYSIVFNEDRTTAFATHGFEHVVYPGYEYRQNETDKEYYLALDRNDSVYVTDVQAPRLLALRFGPYRDTVALKPFFDEYAKSAPLPPERRYVPVRLGPIRGELYLTLLTGNEGSYVCNYLFLWRRGKE